jgi:hypothetical protein
MSAAAETTTMTITSLMIEVAGQLNAEPSADLYSVVAPLVIEHYSSIPRKQLGFEPDSEFGLCHGTVPGKPAMNTQAAVEMVVQLALALGWRNPQPANRFNPSGGNREPIIEAAIELQLRLHAMGLTMRESGYPTGAWHIDAGRSREQMSESGPRSSNVLRRIENLDDPRLLYVVDQLERMRPAVVADLDGNALDVIASNMLLAYDAGARSGNQPGTYPAHIAR